MAGIDPREDATAVTRPPVTVLVLTLIMGTPWRF